MGLGVSVAKEGGGAGGGGVGGSSTTAFSLPSDCWNLASHRTDSRRASGGGKTVFSVSCFSQNSCVFLGVGRGKAAFKERGRRTALKA